MIGHSNQPYLIAEIGGNHEGDLNYAKKLLVEAAEAGADAVKFQTYTPDKIVSRVESPDRHAHFGRFALSTNEYIELADLCVEHEVDFMTSIWDADSFDALNPYVKMHKVGSGDLTNYRLIKLFAETQKPLCIATAMATMAEVKNTVEFIRKVAPDLIPQGNLCVMHCVAMYGEPLDEYANLRAIETLKNELAPEILCGYSDHTVGTVAIKTAISLGAKIIEAHFTDDPSREFRDHHFAQTKESLSEIVTFARRQGNMWGTGEKIPVKAIETDERIRQFRRAVYFRRDMAAGEVASDENLTTLRPNTGIDATEYFQVIGKKLTKDKLAFEQVNWSDFE